MEKGSTRMEENIEDLVRRISSSSMRTIVRPAFTPGNSAKTIKSPAISRLVSPRDPGLFDLNRSPLEVVENAQH